MKLLFILFIFPLAGSAQSDTAKKHKHKFTIEDNCSCKCMHLHGYFCSVKGCRAKEVWVGDWYTGADTVSVKNKKLIIWPGHKEYH